MKRFLLSGSLLALILVSCSGTASEPSQYDVVTVYTAPT